VLLSGAGARFELILTAGDTVQIRNIRDVVLVMTGFWVVVLVVVVVVVERTDGGDTKRINKTFDYNFEHIFNLEILYFFLIFFNLNVKSNQIIYITIIWV